MSDTLRLWLDGQCFQTASRMRGIGRYVDGLIRGIVDHVPHVDLHISLNAGMPQEAVAARDYLSRWIKPDNLHLWHGIAEQGEAIDGLTEKRRLSEIALAFHVACIAPDVALSASPFEGAYDRAVPLLPNSICSAPTASIFYDAIPFRFPERYLSDPMSNRYYQRRLEAFKGFDFNLCISDFARQELLDLVNVACSVNIAAGVSDHFMNSFPPTVREPTKRNHLLYVGGFDWRKNVPAVIDAIGLLNNSLRSTINFLVVGDINIHVEAELKRKWSELNLPDSHLQMLGHISDDALFGYYRNVSAVIQPSLMEGFGLTALEAVLCGTPVIAANAGALPEVIIDKTQLFDPTDPADIARHITQVLNDDGKPALSSQAIDHARKFSWERTATIAIETLTRDVKRQGKADATKEQETAETAATNSVRALNLSPDLINGCLARSEIRSAGVPRLILDATSTVITDGGTGIQRVVKKICAAMPSSLESAVVVGFSDNSNEWFEVSERRLNIGPEETKRTGSRIFFTQNDHILMLDSSWTFHAEHTRSLMNARLRGAQVTTCLYDTVPLRASGFTHIGMPPVFSSWLQAALTYSTGFVCISKAVADEFIDILHHIRFPRALNVGYWPLGADFGPLHEPQRQGISENGAQKFLMVGTLEPRKGYGVALDAFDLLWDKDIDVELTIVGKMGWSADHLVDRIQKHREFGTRLFWRHNATDAELSHEYASANCLIASSFAEGFGLPIVEAGYFGKPIIASDIPVFREVSAKSAASRFFNVGDPASLAECICSFIDDGRRPEPGTYSGEQWENWQESALRLQQVVLQNDWYCRYIPENANSFANPAAIGIFSMTKALNEAESRHAMHIVDGPLSSDGANAKKFIVSITNHSESLWSSKGSAKGTLGVFLSCRLYDGAGFVLREGNRTAIPLIIGPSDTVYMPIEVREEWLTMEGAIVHIELVQEGVRWWRNPILLPTGRNMVPTTCA